MSRLILVSNRLPTGLSEQASSEGSQRASGGLVAALGPVWEGSDSLWIGAPAGRSELLPRLVGVDIPETEGRRYYEGFSNSVLWPLFHYFTESVQLESQSYDAYRNVNQRFADAVVALAGPEDRIWIHDYQLMLVPALVRAKLSTARIGFFLHVPFPSSEVFRILPMAEELLRGVAGADLLGFHTHDYARHFVSSWQRVTGGDFQDGALVLDGRSSQVGVFPLGVDAERLMVQAGSPEVRSKVQNWKRRFAGRKVILGVDRLDYTKGIVHRLRAYRRLLETEPRWARDSVLLQLAVPTRSGIQRYKELKAEIDSLVGEINGAFANDGRTPIHYMYRSVSPAELSALYCLADVLAVTPLRDGMNLVAKEYVGSRLQDSGVLLLSRFAGAAAELGEAVIVNPWDVQGMARSLAQALEMVPEEQERRMAAMRRRVRERSLERWRGSFLETLAGIRAGFAPSESLNAGRLQTAFQGAEHALVLLDYDGTLVDFAATPDGAEPDAGLLSLLGRFTQREDTDVVIVSGREPGSLERWLGRLDVHIVAEHGFFLRERGQTAWTELAGESDLSWLRLVREVMVEYATRTPGAWIEEKKASLAWHYRKAESEHRNQEARELAHHVAEMFRDYPLHVLHGNHVVEVRVHGINKGLAYRALERKLPAADFVLAAGDDRTDEDLFRALPRSAWTIKVGGGPSSARYRCRSVQDFRILLETMLGRTRDGLAPLAAAGKATVKAHEATG